ncbi:MocR-like pyridoxine biosynthesis transcription factor PdxR [Mariniplasma anaerobium]|uniref:GntR family transcriptional regulator n=1 Tax=Mariniplasma anaerobium TaxID=2735436 RepID=A0A7U9TK19_9MOLU|nr:PLP-dependent aminotransferase family protein [Mariniplasma anaerobium]BCR36791.1 GntR family transcriptional regulator [Mariniplasma anaerobium]
MANKKEYIYLEIYNHLKSMILSDVLKENDRLPSKRKLAASFSVSPMTIHKAYQELIDEGYVYTVEKKGYYVSKKVPIFFNQPKIKDIKIKETKDRTYLYDFNTSHVDTTHFPHQTWAKLAREVLSEHRETMLNDVDAHGLYDLRSEIARHLDIYRGMSIDQSQIIIGSSSTQLLSLLIELLGRNNVYGIEDPSYPKIFHLFRTLDIKTNLIQLDAYGLSSKMLEASDTKIVHIVSSHQFPSGITMPIQRRIELLNWAYQETDRYIIEDDYDSEFKYQGRPVPALKGLDKGEKVIYMNTFSKSLAPSFRVAYLVLPIDLMKKFNKVMQYHRCTVPNFEQYILYKFMNKEYFSRHLHKMMKIYREKLDLILDITEQYQKINIKNYESGLHFILSFYAKVSENEIIKQLETRNIHVLGMSLFRQTQHKQKDMIELVIGYSGLSKTQIKLGYTKLLDTISTYTTH